MLYLKKSDEPEIKLPTFIESWKKQRNSRKTSISVSLTTLKPLTVWITTNWNILFFFFFELNLIVFIISFCLFILNFFYLFITLQYWIAFAIRQHESTMGIHKFQDWNILKETKIPHHHVCLLRNLYVCQEAIEPDMEQCTVSKLGKEYIKGIYFHQIT